MAPVISAGVMTANIIWNAKNAKPGMSPSSVVTSFMNAKSRLPTIGLSPPNAIEKPMIAHSVEMMPIAKMFCISMPSTFFERTMPP